MEHFQYLNSDFVNSNGLIYRINRAGSGDVGRDFYIERNSSYPYCVIHYVIKGSGEVCYRGKKYSVKKGQCFVLNCFEEHRYSSNPRDPFKLNWIEFNGGDSAKLIGAFLNTCLPVVDELKSKTINKYILRSFVNLKNSNKKSDILVSKTIYSIMMLLLDECISEECFELPESNIRDIQKIIDYINCNLKESLSIGELARLINYNPQYFSKLFKRHRGITPAKYIMDRRISRAKEQLSLGDIQIDLLAEQLGFCNASHFIRNFKKAEGLTPAEFRRESISYYKK